MLNFILICLIKIFIFIFKDAQVIGETLAKEDKCQSITEANN
jgi:hypothetical protein